LVYKLDGKVSKIRKAIDDFCHIFLKKPNNSVLQKKELENQLL